MRNVLLLFLIFLSQAVLAQKRFQLKVNPSRPVSERLGGTDFYKMAAAWKWKSRDSLAVKEILSGNIPSFLKKFVRIQVSLPDSASGKRIRAFYFVAPDYLSVGTDKDWARIPLSPMAAQQIADSFHCFLPTRKMVNDIYAAAVIKLEPIPMYAFRDSSVTMWQHHLIVEGQRKLKKGLIAGIKKDLVITEQLNPLSKINHEAIYGWHLLSGKPIQPLYTGHINWWVDYSHGVRLVYEYIYVNGRKMHYTAVLADPVLKKLLCDEVLCNYFRYPY